MPLARPYPQQSSVRGGLVRRGAGNGCSHTMNDGRRSIVSWRRRSWDGSASRAVFLEFTRTAIGCLLAASGDPNAPSAYPRRRHCCLVRRRYADQCLPVRMAAASDQDRLVHIVTIAHAHRNRHGQARSNGRTGDLSRVPSRGVRMAGIVKPSDAPARSTYTTSAVWRRSPLTSGNTFSAKRCISACSG